MNMIATQKEISQLIQQVISQGISLTWDEFVDKIAGDHEALSRYTSLIKVTPAMDKPQELMVQFTTIRNVFVSTEAKMMKLLEDAGFTPEVDFYLLDVNNEQYEESLLFISYNCIKMYVMHTKDDSLLLALLMGEQIHAQYQSIDGSASKATSSSTDYYMLVEQKKFNLETKTAIVPYIKSMDHPKVVLVWCKGTKANLLKKIDEMKKDKDTWGDIIIPITSAIHVDAKDDVARVVEHVKDMLIKPYKASERAKIADANKDVKKEEREKVSVSTKSWGVLAQSQYFMVNPNLRKVPFTHKDIVKCVKEFYVNTLAQRHVEINQLSHKKYLELIDELQVERIERPGLFSAVKSNAFYCAKITAAKKLIARAEKAASKEEKATKGKKGSSPPKSRSAPKVSHDYETEGSGADVKSKAKAESDEEEKPKAKTTRKTTKVESDEEKPKPKPKAKAKSTTRKEIKDESEEEEKPKAKAKPAARKTTKVESDEEKPKSKPKANAKSTTRKEIKDESEEEVKPKAKAKSTTRKEEVKPKVKVDDIDSETERFASELEEYVSDGEAITLPEDIVNSDVEEEDYKTCGSDDE